MKKILITIFTLGSLFMMTSCAHHDSSPKHHHHAYEKQCAYSVSQGNTHVAGKDEYKVDHGGKTYYFSSKENMSLFKENISNNIKNANRQWLGRTEK